jgi:hypothetical protein
MGSLLFKNGGLHLNLNYMPTKLNPIVLLFASIIILLIITPPVKARLGETREHLIDCYGPITEGTKKEGGLLSAIDVGSVSPSPSDEGLNHKPITLLEMAFQKGEASYSEENLVSKIFRITVSIFLAIGSLKFIRISWLQAFYGGDGFLFFISRLVGETLLVSCILLSLQHNSWRMLGFGSASCSIIAVIGLDLILMRKAASFRKRKLVHLIVSLPWWSGVLASLFFGSWQLLFIGIAISTFLNYAIAPLFHDSPVDESGVK